MKPVGWILRRAVGITFCVLMMPLAQACDGAQWDGPIAQASDRLHVDRALIHAVMQVESAACERIDGKLTTSPAGAMGLMQIMPATWDRYRERLDLGTDPYNPPDNILAGTAYLHDLIEQLGLFEGLAAYFAGPSAVIDNRNDRTLPSSATLRYVHDVLGMLAAEPARPTSRVTVSNGPLSPLFAIERRGEQRADDIANPPSSTLFAIARSRVAHEGPDNDRADSRQ